MANFRPDQSISALKLDMGGANEQSYITPSAMGGTGEVQTITVPATASAAQGDYFVLEEPGGDKIAFWLDIDADGTEPTGAAYVASDNQVEINIVTGGTAVQNAALVAAAIESVGAFSVVDNENGTVAATFNMVGNAPAPTRHNTGDTGNGSFLVATTTAGTAATVQSKYFTVSNTSTDFYIWFNVTGAGVDPSPGGTGVELTLDGDETNSEYIAYIAATIDAQTGLSAEVDGSRINVYVDSIGAATDLGAGDSGFEVSIGSQGGAVQGIVPSTSVTGLSVTAQTIS